MSAREIEKMKKAYVVFICFEKLMITINGGQLELLYLILEQGRDCEDEALEAWKMFVFKVQKYDESRCDLEWAEMRKKTTS